MVNVRKMEVTNVHLEYLQPLTSNKSSKIGIYPSSLEIDKMLVVKDRSYLLQSFSKDSYDLWQSFNIQNTMLDSKPCVIIRSLQVYNVPTAINIVYFGTLLQSWKLMAVGILKRTLLSL